MKRVALLLLVLAGCKSRPSSFAGTVPLGWKGGIPSCDYAQIKSGSAMTGQESYLVAVAEGEVVLACKNDETGVAVKAIDHLVIAGETELTSGEARYELQAYAAGNEQLFLGEPDYGTISWTVSAPATIEGGYELSHAGHVPHHRAKLRLDEVGKRVQIRVDFAGRHAELDVVRTADAARGTKTR